MTSFSDLGLMAPICQAVAAEGYETATPIQEQAIPVVLSGQDVLGLAQTGTGKTAAFSLPILHRLAEAKKRPGPKKVRCLVLTPTRELAVQVGASFATYGVHLRFKRTVITGGVGFTPQMNALAGGLDIVVATPGRLLDLAQRGYAQLDEVECFVLDEADRMFDMGFINDIKKIIAMLPKQRVNLLFSATMPPAVAQLAEQTLKNHKRIEVTPASSTVERIEQKVMFVQKDKKKDLLVSVLKEQDINRVIIFTRTKHGANRLAEQLGKQGIPAEAIHGNKSQGARQRALSEFQSGKVRALVATDIAARGIDVEGVSHVVNYELPNEPESYVHRIGRTARAGAEGVALSFCEMEEIPYLRAIEKVIRQEVPGDDAHAFHDASIASQRNSSHIKPPQLQRGGNKGRGGHGGQSNPGGQKRQGQGHGGQGHGGHGQGQGHGQSRGSQQGRGGRSGQG
ncbi:MAG: DEAD/DEAH box helicase, partial [Burkholderiales bacterium]|nr:DEAD/DEAH box helicase [Burkholderiales bacterium]